jgi:hypothetical protein
VNFRAILGGAVTQIRISREALPLTLAAVSHCPRVSHRRPMGTDLT